ncbi:hypothetical protein LWI29_006840 [Acer saccharum]|uniref:Uncharacterized protein n=1 Tax=Acer saccharum TaxID=4024 RepID=A0AA39V6R9_ACESA|nr:hypothetical protein LWI29_006840 [Acer saccharum]
MVIGGKSFVVQASEESASIDSLWLKSFIALDNVECVKEGTVDGGKSEHMDKKTKKSNVDLTFHNSSMNSNETAWVVAKPMLFKLKSENVAELVVDRGARVIRKRCGTRGSKMKVGKPIFSNSDLGSKFSRDLDSGKVCGDGSFPSLVDKDFSVGLFLNSHFLRGDSSNKGKVCEVGLVQGVVSMDTKRKCPPEEMLKDEVVCEGSSTENPISLKGSVSIRDTSVLSGP